MNYARKNGRVYTVYSEPVTDWENPPDDFLVQTVIAENDAHFGMQFPGVAILDRPAQPKGIASSKPNPASVIAAISSMDLPPEVAEKLRQKVIGSTTLAPVAPLQDNPGKGVGAVIEASQVADKAILEYRLAAARNSPNLQVLRKFILRLWPDLERDLDLVEQLEKDGGL